MKIYAWLILCAFVFVGCQNATTNNQITVSAAASLQDAFREIARDFEARENVKINFNFAASGVLQKQIEQRAPVDVFASASESQMNQLAAQNLIDDVTRRDFARNELVLIVRADAANKIQSFADLVKNDTARVAVGNPKTVPAGQYAQMTLTNLGMWDKLQSRLIFAEDVRQVLDYVARGEVECGLVYASDTQTAADKIKIVARAPENSHSPILYPIARLKSSANQAASAKFIEFVTGADGQRILQKYGFR